MRGPTDEQLAEWRRKAAIAVERAKALVKPGDRISRRLCGGARGHFTFTRWDGKWMCGKTVSDCHPSSVYRLNGEPVDFEAEGGS